MQSEIEARFLEIDKQKLINTLVALGAKDEGEALLSEVIFYDDPNIWQAQKRFVRLRTKDGVTVMTYKHHHAQAIDGAKEVEFAVPDIQTAEAFLTGIGLKAYRHQEKKRHTLHLDDVTVDIDTWPSVPTYAELEGPSETHIKELAAKIGLDWNDAVFMDAAAIIREHYNVPVLTSTWFTFDRIE